MSIADADRKDIGVTVIRMARVRAMCCIPALLAVGLLTMPALATTNGRPPSLTPLFNPRAVLPPPGSPTRAIQLPRPFGLSPQASASLPPRAVTEQQRAIEIERRSGLASHSVATGQGTLRRYDLSGHGHRDNNGIKVPTPHVVDERDNINVNPHTGQSYVNRPRQSEVRPMTHSDLRTLERALRERGE